MKSVSAEKVTYRYQGAPSAAIESVDFYAGSGRKTVLLGENGCGKSTLIYHLNGVYKPESGTVYYDGNPISYDRDFLTELRSEVSVVLQNPDDQIFSSTVEEDVAFGPLNAGFSREEVSERISWALEKVGMEEYAETQVQRLSYGQRKRVSIAGALALRPKVLILDEPTAGLDPQISKEIMELADRSASGGVNVIVSSHDINLTYSWADDLSVMRSGRIVFSGDPSDFFGNSREVYLSGLVSPSVFSINYNVETMRGRNPDPYPKTITQTVGKMFPSGESKGTIHIYCPDGGKIDQDALECAAGRKEITAAVYGPFARKAVSESKMRIDYYYNGIEGCITEALANRDSLLICDKELKKSVLDAVDAMETFGTAIRTKEIVL
ncbi:MAG: energy-coupling factor ABC transporter ATP-binding protein [Candidatus Methanomethylophilaceae archaeon]|jgi:cobalt/nickel transport system ATP-binding protein